MSAAAVKTLASMPTSCPHNASTFPGPLARWRCVWDEKHLGIDRNFELMGPEKSRLLRLRPDYKDVVGWFPNSRTDYMTVVVREAFRMGYCELVGGFIRDWIIRGEEPNDIDFRLWKRFDVDEFVEKCCKRWKLKQEDDKKPTKITFLTPHGQRFEIDYVFAEIFEQKGDRGVDLDVNSLAISADLGLHKRAYTSRPLCKTYGNIKRKVAYLIEYHPEEGRCDIVSDRVKKMQKSGWTILNATSLQKNCDFSLTASKRSSDEL